MILTPRYDTIVKLRNPDGLEYAVDMSSIRVTSGTSLLLRERFESEAAATDAERKGPTHIFTRMEPYEAALARLRFARMGVEA